MNGFPFVANVVLFKEMSDPGYLAWPVNGAYSENFVLTSGCSPVVFKVGGHLPDAKAFLPLFPVASVLVLQLDVTTILDWMTSQLFDKARDAFLAALFHQFQDPLQVEWLSDVLPSTLAAQDYPVDAFQVELGSRNRCPQRFDRQATYLSIDATKFVDAVEHAVGSYRRHRTDIGGQTAE